MAYYDINGKEIQLTDTQRATNMLGTRMIWDSSLNGGQGGSAGVWYDTPQNAQEINQRNTEYDQAIAAMDQRRAAAGMQPVSVTAGPQQTAPTAQAVAQQNVPNSGLLDAPKKNMMMRPQGLLNQSIQQRPQGFQQGPSFQARPFGQYSAWGMPTRFGSYQQGQNGSPFGWNQNLGFGFNPFRGR